MKNKKEYDLILFSIIKSKKRIIDTISDKIIPNKEEFKDYFLNNIKKSSFLAQILPSVLFLVISLISFSVVVLSRNMTNLEAWLNEEMLLIPILGFGVVFLILGLILLFQKLIFKTKVINIQYIHKKGFYNVSLNKYKEIIELIER